jgi:hypothetical protein
MADWYTLKDGKHPEPADNWLAGAVWLQEAPDDVRIVGRSTAPDGATLSTVFLGMDHGFPGRGLPVLFESLWFGGAQDGAMRRYHTRDEAEAGHAEMLAAYPELPEGW